tara:strand:+ start:16160 stop:16849 length:690 start_codon:yes stop_codon:yes gene_type:complete
MGKLKDKSFERMADMEKQLESGDYIPDEAEVEQWGTQAGEQARMQVQGLGTQVAQQAGPPGQMSGQTQEALMDLGETSGEAQAQANLGARGLQQEIGEKRAQALRDNLQREHEFARQMNQETANNVINGIGTAAGIGGLVLGGLALAAMCWVAEAIFGKHADKTFYARYYCYRNPANLFVRLYSKYGQAWAKWLTQNPWAKPVVRPIWEYLAWRGKHLLEESKVEVTHG